MDWGITVHDADLVAVDRFLEEHGYTHVVTPYGIKWRLMFRSGGRVKAAAYLFCFDREIEDNLEVIGRVNSGLSPLVLVLDRQNIFSEVGHYTCPDAPTLQDLFASLDREGVTFERVPIGDFVVYHRFSRPVLLPEMSQVDTTGLAKRSVPR